MSDQALQNLQIVMVGTRFPENVGMAARACANMGCGGLTLVAPERWDVEKARPLATPKGEPKLNELNITGSLAEAVGNAVRVYGTTARIGGWRRAFLTPEQAAQDMIPLLLEGSPVALVFGPEDRGLENEEIRQCQRLVSIPVAAEASSLNVAQAVLILSYAVRTGILKQSGATLLPADSGAVSRRITQGEMELLYTNIREALINIDFLRKDNPDYFLMPVRRLLGRVDLRRHEMDILMGICRQIKNLCQRTLSK